MTTAPVKVATKVATATRKVPDTEPKRAHAKCRIHLVCLTLSGMLFYVVFHYHVGNELFDSFGPLIPNVFQEILDEIKRL